MDIYKSSLKYAKENGELEQYRESMNLCDECGTLISRSIAEKFNNNYLDVKKVTAEAVGKYGFERAMLMLALRIDSLNYDGRFTADNKEWAQKFLADYPNAEEIRKTADRTLGTAHPVLLNAVTEELRSAFREMNKQEIEGYRIVQRIQTPNSEFILGQNNKMPGCYVTWYNADHNGGLSTVWGHYFTSNDSQNNLVSAYRDLFSRALSDVNQHTRFEELTPKIGSIIRTVNGEDSLAVGTLTTSDSTAVQTGMTGAYETGEQSGIPMTAVSAMTTKYYFCLMQICITEIICSTGSLQLSFSHSLIIATNPFI